MKKLLLLLFLPLLFIVAPKSAHAESSVPDKPINGIYDPNHYLSDSISTKLSDMNSKSETQIGIYIVDTLDGDSIETRANDIARAWKIGYSDSNKGALIAIAIKDRKFRIETSNELATTLTDSKARHILDGSKSYMRNGDYDGAITHILDEIYDETRPKTDEEIQAEQEHTQKVKNTEKILFQILIGSAILIISLKVIVIAIQEIIDLLDYYIRLRHSKYDYQGEDKLTPKDDDFVDNNTWTVDRLTQFRDTDWLERSQYSYHGHDKLYPGQLHFKMNPSWTTERIREYNDRQEREKRERKERERRIAEDKLRRSKHDYKGSDKLYPDDYDFVNNATWTALLVEQYLETKRQQHYHDTWSSGSSSYSGGSSHSSDSGSSWSSGDWGGGGFDGGGASTGW